MADLGYKINVQLPDEPHPGVLVIISGNETIKVLQQHINKKVRKLFKRGYKCQYITNNDGSVLDPDFTLLSALLPEDSVSSHQTKLKTLGTIVAPPGGPVKASKKRTAESAGITGAVASISAPSPSAATAAATAPVPAPAPTAAAAAGTTAANGNDSSDDNDDDSSSDDDDDDFENKEAAAASAAKKAAPGPKPAPPPAAPEPPTKKPKKEKKVRDPNMPKRAPNHFMLFMEKNRAKIVGEGFVGKHVMSEASRRWGELPPAEKMPFTEEARELKTSYDTLMAAYKTTLEV